ncbi:Na(+)/H(+) antiporter subunit B [Streptomyces sp. NBC_00454]|uniref:Na(+)/H(+) antiporter subunit B n=1 Tax=Streptomyces sp. NBC_00454 TaxID=2975747 RepID=UPI00352EFBAD
MNANTIDILVAVVLLAVVVAATVAALTRDPVRQAAVLAMLGLTLALLFTVLQAPDVALSQLGVGTAVTPLLILLTVRKIRGAGSPGGQPNPGQPNPEQPDPEQPDPDRPQPDRPQPERPSRRERRSR